MEFIGFLSQNMLLRHENVQIEVCCSWFPVFILITVTIL